MLTESGGWGVGIESVVLAINVSLLEQCSYNAPILPGKSFFHLAILSVLDLMHWFPIMVLKK